MKATDRIDQPAPSPSAASPPDGTRVNEPRAAAGLDTEVLERETGFGWGWFVVLGAALVVLGLLASVDVRPADNASVYAIGVFMLTGALAQLGTLLLVPRWRGVGALALSALSYGAAAVCAIVGPTLAAMPLTLLLAVALIFSGAMRVRITSVMPALPGSSWVMASGVVSLVAGFAFVHLLFARTVWLLAATLAVDLGFQGAMTLAFGFALKAGARTR